MKIKYLITLLLLSSTSLINFRCRPECSAALADLITEVAFQGTVSITAGVPFDVPNAIENVRNTLDACGDDIRETLTAGASKSRLQVDYDPSGSGSFTENVLNDNFNVNPIPAGMVADEIYRMTFTEPGDYRLITFADDKQDVEERDETNNDSDPEYVNPRGTEAARTKGLIIRVLPNPDFQRAPGQPKVIVNSRTVAIHPK